MSVAATRWSQRQAAQAAGVTRAAVLSAVHDGLIGPGDLDAADLVVLRAAATTRTLLFPGESQPANSSRPVRPRERLLAEAVRALAAQLRGGADVSATSVAIHRDRVETCTNQGDLLMALLRAQEAAEPCLTLPVGSWLTRTYREARDDLR